MIMAGHVPLLLEIALGGFAAALCSSLAVSAVSTRHRRRLTGAIYAMPPWTHPRRGVLVGATERLTLGATPAEQSTAFRLQQWLRLNGASATLLTDLPSARAFLERHEATGWGVYVPAYAHVRMAYEAADHPDGADAPSILKREASEWLSLLRARGVARLAVVGFYDPLSFHEISLPEQQARMSEAIALLNGVLHAIADEHRADFLPMGEAFGERAEEFTGVYQGSDALNTNGHLIQVGLLQAWLLGEATPAESLSAERLFKLATGLGPG